MGQRGELTFLIGTACRLCQNALLNLVCSNREKARLTVNRRCNCGVENLRSSKMAPLDKFISANRCLPLLHSFTFSVFYLNGKTLLPGLKK